MMDTQRIIALVVFSFSALLLWEGWQKHNAPRVPAAASAPAATGIPSHSALNAPGTSTPATPVPGAQPGTAAPPVPVTGAPAVAGQPIEVKTDLFDIEINTAGGDIRRVTMRQVFSAKDLHQPLTLLEANPKHYFVTQSGLLGDALPNHKTPYQADGRSFALGAGQDTLEVRLTAREGAAEVVKRFTFRRGSYEIKVSYEITNASDKPIAPYAYFQFLRDANPPSEDTVQTSSFAGVTTFTGPAVYTEESKFVKVDFKDIDKGKTPYPKKTKDGWIAMVQHYFVSAWIPKQGVEREYFTNKVGDLYASGVVIPVGTIAPAASTSVEVPVYIGPQ
ncbi:MAG TPA: membrane protein insertase YidC, partial [Tepidisphaeraceae bacterium]|nr:membrane protein insertase YidC [Tepidisphaeraceae bacterium]